jgi:hypothetical protein
MRKRRGDCPVTAASSVNAELSGSACDSASEAAEWRSALWWGERARRACKSQDPKILESWNPGGLTDDRRAKILHSPSSMSMSMSISRQPYVEVEASGVSLTLSCQDSRLQDSREQEEQVHLPGPASLPTCQPASLLPSSPPPHLTSASPLAESPTAPTEPVRPHHARLTQLSLLPKPYLVTALLTAKNPPTPPPPLPPPPAQIASRAPQSVP